MVSLPWKCSHCGKLKHDYSACRCPQSTLDWIETERRAIVLRLARLDEIEAEAKANLFTNGEQA